MFHYDNLINILSLLGLQVIGLDLLPDMPFKIPLLMQKK